MTVGGLGQRTLIGERCHTDRGKEGLTEEGHAMAVGEAPSNWLSKVFKQKRESIERILPFFERKAERDAIVAAIQGHPKGAELANKPNLADVVWAAIGVANQAERDQKRNPVMRASPDIKASWFVFDELGVPLPDSEF